MIQICCSKVPTHERQQKVIFFQSSNFSVTKNTSKEILKNELHNLKLGKQVIDNNINLFQRVHELRKQ
jgi:hypothetical protein